MAELVLNGFTLQMLPVTKNKHIILDTKRSVIWQVRAKGHSGEVTALQMIAFVELLQISLYFDLILTSPKILSNFISWEYSYPQGILISVGLLDYLVVLFLEVFSHCFPQLLQQVLYFHLLYGDRPRVTESRGLQSWKNESKRCYLYQLYKTIKY